MSSTSTEKIADALAAFTSATRLYELTIGEDADASLLVEAWAADEQLQAIGARDIIALSTSAHVALASLLGQPASLHISLADGTRTPFSGYISAAAMLGSNGGLARYRLRITPWLWLLTQVRNSRVWQDRSVMAIVDEVFQAYAPYALWRWSDEVASFMQEAGERSYCCQYRESDFDFVRRLLTEEGLAWRFDDQTMLVFADSSQACATPEDASSAQTGGLRFHGARVGEPGDSVQAVSARRSLRPGLSSVLSYDYKAKKAVAASVPANIALGGKNAPVLESYDTPGQYWYASAAQAQRYAQLQMQAHEARAQLWQARSTVRTLRAGTRFTLTQGPLQPADGAAPGYVVLRVASIGVNNLPVPALEGLAELFGPIPELLEEAVAQWSAGFPDFAAAIAQAQASGYANCLEMLTASTPWRPLQNGSDARQHATPTALGSQSAIVVGADGNDVASGADDIHCDQLGRVRIRFHWQQEQHAGCWVRVAQRAAGGGMGSQFLPRIGQEVLVQFLENDIDRPVIIGALYNGQGEGGSQPTPGGVARAPGDTGVFQPAHDHAVAGQGNLAGGNSPLWHGAAGASAEHRSGAAQWGIRSKEFGKAGGMAGYNQLLFDDTDGQGRVQLKSSHAASELNLGHLIHGADNYRGSLRGAGAELRTDAYGALRAKAGLLVSSYVLRHDAAQREPAGDNAGGMALLKQAVLLGDTFSQAARTHQTVAYASHIGASAPNASELDEQAAPLKAMLASVAGMHEALPQTRDAIIAIAAKADLAVIAGQDLQLANGESVVLMSGQDTQFIGGGQWRLHAGQAIGMLGGAVKAGEGDAGAQLIAAQGAIDAQAQGDVLQIQAREEINVVSANAHVDWAAAKSLRLSTAGGANITIEGGSITIQCPGKITVYAGKKSFIGPTRAPYVMPPLPLSTCKNCILSAMQQGAPGVLR